MSFQWKSTKKGSRMPEEDEPFWSRHRLFDAFCLWLYFAIEPGNAWSLRQCFLYYRRPYAAHLKEKR